MIEALDTKKMRMLLLGTHCLILVLAFCLPHAPSPDQATYMGLANGLAHGVYSVWYGILDPAPIDLLRTHGYPVFLLLVGSISTRADLVFAAQAVLHLGTLLIILRLVGKGEHPVRRQNMFLILMIPQVQVIYYVYQIFPETLMSFLSTWLVLVFAGTGGEKQRCVLLAVVSALAFWVRPVILLFPLFVLLADLLFVGKGTRFARARFNSSSLALFLILGPLPFGLWNLQQHGVFKPVPLSGSAVNSNLGIWQLRLPGYGTMHYFQYNYFGREFIPLVNEKEAARYYEAYQEQWARIDAATQGAMTAQDKLNKPLMAEHINELYVTRSPQYTVALDQAIAKENRQMMVNEPFYYLATRLYAGLRLWVTNINFPMTKIVYEPKPGVQPIVGRPAGMKSWIGSLAPFALTAVSFGIGLPWLVYQIIRDRRKWIERRYMLYLVAYLWIIHIPMSIQSRYTIPVHAIAIACIAMALVDKREARNPVSVIG